MMMYSKNFFLFFISIFLIVVNQVFAQQLYLIKPKNADCKNAIMLKDTVFGPTNAPDGFGDVMEVTSNKKSSFCFEKEHNTVWYKFTVTHDCDLTYDIIPVDINDDYDFVLYKYTDKDFCNLIKSKQINPVRTNISRNDKKTESKTGLSMTGNKKFVHYGTGPCYSKFLKVKKREIYYLVVDNVYENGKGHTLNIKYRNCSDTGILQHNKKNKKHLIAKKDKNKSEITLNINAVDKESGKLINARIDIIDIEKEKLELPDSKVNFENVSSCFTTIKPLGTYIIYISAKGYFNYTKRIYTSNKQKDISIKAELDKIKTGKNIILDNILFYGNSDKFLAYSYTALKQLLNFLNNNKNVNIEIQGHVNGPDKGHDYHFQLSLDRAKAVYNYLLQNGVGDERIKYKGFANNRMIYPSPVNERQAEMNRRVEIMVLSY
jgi:outer membrane protein OmpA-like peptidoglycan-associated protein